ncbi:hypothetical protein GGR51DRAFT_498878 [Nemania sp. FL0031]|nr:hypothetical protein GGR51DRAFT_498878 [Nemania sp. FL0031]
MVRTLILAMTTWVFYTSIARISGPRPGRQYEMHSSTVCSYGRFSVTGSFQSPCFLVCRSPWFRRLSKRSSRRRDSIVHCLHPQVFTYLRTIVQQAQAV